MPLPNYQQCMLPILQLAGQQRLISLSDARYHVVKVFGLNSEEAEQRLPSGRETVLKNRVGWARTYLKKAELLSYPSPGNMTITRKGKNLLEKAPLSITTLFLKSLPNFESNWQCAQNELDPKNSAVETAVSTPSELFEKCYKEMRDLNIADLQSRLETCSPEFFKNLVPEAMLALGYGGSLKDAGSSIGKTGDGGLNGIIKEDRLGLRVIYLQAKRWKGSVGSPKSVISQERSKEKRQGRVFLLPPRILPGQHAITSTRSTQK